MALIIKPYNHIAETGLSFFNAPFFSVDPKSDDPHGIVLRSADLHKEPFQPSLLAVARAGAGYNHVPVSQLTARAIPVMNTPGANANAVKELVIAAVLIGARHLLKAWDVTRSLKGNHEEMSLCVETIKKEYTGFELQSCVLGVIGLGKIGVLVANACTQLGMTVWGYDPHISVANAWQLDARVQQADGLSTLLSQVNCLTLHVPLTKETKDLIHHEELAQLKPGSMLLNFSRSGIVNIEAVCQALESKHLHQYLCDFPDPQLQQQKNAFSFPHLGASTLEAADNCAKMACAQLREYLLSGNLKHCVNFPDLELTTRTTARLCIFNKNVPNMVAQITQALSQQGININNLANRSIDDRAYNLIDIDRPCFDSTIQTIQQIPGITRVRQLIF